MKGCRVVIFIGLIFQVGLQAPAQAAWFCNRQILELNREYPAPNEAANFENLARRLNAIQAKRLLIDGIARRGFHGKLHGLVAGKFRVVEDRPDVTKFGIFSEAKTYPLWVRFSNAQTEIKSDTKPDFRGMAVKIMDVAGPRLLESSAETQTQDFLMTNKSRATTKDANTFIDFAEASQGKWWEMPWFFLKHPRVAYSIIRGASRKIPSVLTEQYWSGAPIMLGNRAVKFTVQPSWLETPDLPASPSDHYLKDQLVKRLRAQEMRFDFMIQFQSDPYKTPIEDGFKEWKEEDSPFIKVAEIILHPQDVDTPERGHAAEILEFTPWNGIQAHRPIGNIMRARRIVYQASADFRLYGRPIEPMADPKTAIP